MLERVLRSVFLFALFGLFGLPLVNAQTSAQQIAANLSSDPRVAQFTMDESRGTPALIKMNETGVTLPLGETPGFLQTVLQFGNETSFIAQAATSTSGVQVDKYQQYTNGIKVEHGVFKALSRKGIVIGFIAEYYSVPSTLSSSPALSEAAALQKALDHVGATLYAWDYVLSLGNSAAHVAAYNELFPDGQLVYVDNYLTQAVDLKLAYKFNVYAVSPLSRANIYVDATSGAVLLLDAIIKHADDMNGKAEVANTIESYEEPILPAPVGNASGHTRYAGTRTFSTSLDANGHWVLNGVTPTGVENETRSYEGIGGLPLSIPALAMLTVPIADGDGNLLHPETADNSWTSAEHRKSNFSTTSPYPLANESNNDDVALDAHWGAEIVLEYWKNVHNRLSYDNNGTKITNYVHYGDSYDNAFWNGTAMTYGDGTYQGGTRPNGGFAPLTSMDVCAHEIGHGVCEFTSNLVYQRESGAMNEGFSDIWAASVEHYVLTEIDGALPYDPWGIGEQIDERDGGLPPGNPGSRTLRWMDDPKANGDPDCYGGTNWSEPECGTPTLANDQCGVHTNSGVLNKWYYFLVAGSGQSFSPGFNKQPADDQLSDAGNQYSVEGLGFLKAAQIAYLAETMLSPNSKFADMRAASILAAQTLFGLASNEEKQTTNAWHAVDIGGAYNEGEPNTITFNESNIRVLSENNLINGCEDFNAFDIVIKGVDISPGSNISLSTAGSTASLGDDFDISTSSLSFEGTETKTLTITVYDDGEIEEPETIVLSFVFNDQFQQQEFTISSNDFAPRTGTDPIDLLPAQTFTEDGIPAGWSTVALSEGTNIWKVNGDLTAAGRAYVSNGITDIPFYDQLSPSNTILRSPLINAAATKAVTVSFDWEAGGELDAVDPTIIFDYGEFVYSLDGVDYVPLQKFTGTGPLGVNTASGNYSSVIPDLDGQSFYLGWRWYNDTNAGSQFSFAIDNVKVSATPAGIETEANESSTATVHAGKVVYFMSASDQALIAKIENASEDLGCVTISIAQGGSGSSAFPYIATTRASKTFTIAVGNDDATYNLTTYFTNEELNAFGSPTQLIPMKVNSSNIDDATDRPNNFQLNGVVTDVNAEGQFHAFTGSFSGSGSVSVVENFAYCANAPSPWTSVDIGSVGEAGTLCHIDGNFEVAASGAGISDREDSFHFVYQPMAGDGEIIAQIRSLQNTSTRARAAVMIREELTANSVFAMTTITTSSLLVGSGARLDYRKTTGAKMGGGSNVAASTPEFVKIVRSGNTINSYISEAGTVWRLIGTVSIKFGSTAYVGLAATSGVFGTSGSAEFASVTITGPPQTSGRMIADQRQVNSEEISPEVSTYPNPASATVNIEVTESAIKTIAIYNNLGQMVKEVHFTIPEKTVEVDVTELSKGFFVMKIQTEAGKMLDRRLFKR